MENTLVARSPGRSHGKKSEEAQDNENQGHRSEAVEERGQPEENAATGQQAQGRDHRSERAVQARRLGWMR
jgi:hypothetical protein